MYIFIKETTGNSAEVTSIYYADILTDEQKEYAISVTGIPAAEEIPLKSPVLMYNKADNTLYYEYLDLEPTEKEEIAAIRDENAALMFRSATQEMAITSLQDENAELMFRLANLEMGGI